PRLHSRPTRRSSDLAVRAQADKVRAAAMAAGRPADAIKVFMGISVIVAPSEAEARDKLAEYQRHASPEAGIAHFSASTGIDLAADRKSTRLHSSHVK